MDLFIFIKFKTNFLGRPTLLFLSSPICVAQDNIYKIYNTRMLKKAYEFFWVT